MATDSCAYKMVLLFCRNETETFIPSRKEESYYLRPSCADCIVVKEDTVMIKYLFLLSRKTTIDVADVKQFVTLSLCHHEPRSVGVYSDYDFENCNDFESNELSEEETTIIGTRVELLMQNLIKCVLQYIWSWITALGEIICRGGL